MWGTSMKTHTQGINCEVPQIQHKNKYLKYESVISKITNVNKVMLSSLYFSPSSAEYHFEILKRHGATSPLPSPSLYFLSTMVLTKMDTAVVLLCLSILSVERITRSDLLSTHDITSLPLPSFGSECISKGDLIFLKLTTSFDIIGMFIYNIISYCIIAYYIMLYYIV